MAEQMWFGTEERMGWIVAPNSGATMSPEGWGAGGTLIGGGGYQFNSWGTHKVYTFEWPDSSAPGAAQLMKSYRDGTYGRGLIYFVDPLIYELNVLPARLADPSMAIGDESATLVYDANPTPIANVGDASNNLPVTGALYDLMGVTPGHRPGESIFVPIPQGYTLHVTAYYASTGSGGFFAAPQVAKGAVGSPVKLTANAAGVVTPSSNAFSGVSGVRVWLGRSSSTAGTVSAYGIQARLVKTGKPLPESKWIGGMGHSGVKFVGTPTYIANNGVGGGQVGYAASFREVGSWSYA